MHFYGLGWDEYRSLPVDVHKALVQYRKKVLDAQKR